MLDELWDSSTKLFNPRKIDETFKAEIPKASIKKAWIVLGIAVILSVLISIINTVEAAHFSIFTYDTLAEVADVEDIQVDWSPFWPFVVSRTGILIPSMLAIIYAFERLNFEVLKRTGGKGEFKGQFYIISIIAFALMIASSLLFIAPVPCIGAPIVILFILLSLYFGIFVTGKAYQAVHGIGFWHAIGVVIIMNIPKMISMFLVYQLFIILGLPELPFELIKYV